MKQIKVTIEQGVSKMGREYYVMFAHTALLGRKALTFDRDVLSAVLGTSVETVKLPVELMLTVKE